MTSLGNNARLFAGPYRREKLRWLFETVLECARWLRSNTYRRRTDKDRPDKRAG